MDSKTLAPTHTKLPAMRRALALLVGGMLLVAICIALLVAPLLALVGGAWAAVIEARTIAAIWMLARHQDYSAVFGRLATLDTASRVAFLGVSFFALLFALMLLMAGLLGRRWARLFIAPGLIFTAPTLVCYVIGWLWLTPVAERHGVSSFAQTSLAAYMLLDAVVLAAALCDMRPTLRRARRVARLGKRTRPSLPAVHIASAGQAAITTAPGARLASPTLHSTASVELMADEYADGPRAYPPPHFALRAPITRPMAAVRIEDVASTASHVSADLEHDEFAISAEAETWRIFSGEWAAWGVNDMALHQEVTLPALDWPDVDEDIGDDRAAMPAVRANTPPAPSAALPTASPAAPQDGPQDAPNGQADHIGGANQATILALVEAAIAPTLIVPDSLLAPTDGSESPILPTPPAEPTAKPAMSLGLEPPAAHLEQRTEAVVAPVAPVAVAPVAVAPVAVAPLTDTAQFGALVAIPEGPEPADAPLMPDAPLAFALA